MTRNSKPAIVGIVGLGIMGGAFARHLRARKRKQKAGSSHSSFRVLYRVFLRLQGAREGSCLPNV